MLKDLLASLKEATAKTQARRLESDAFMETITQPQPQLPVGQSNQPTGQGRGRTVNTGNAKLDSFLNAVATQESGGNYDAVGIPTKYGTAYGKYQILDSNIKGPGGWDEEALGRNINIKKFLNTPRLQEKIAKAKLAEYFRQYGAEGAAKAWYAGPGNANTNSDSPQYGGPSINDYASSVLRHMRGGG